MMQKGKRVHEEQPNKTITNSYKNQSPKKSHHYSEQTSIIEINSKKLKINNNTNVYELNLIGHERYDKDK